MKKIMILWCMAILAVAGVRAQAEMMFMRYPTVQDIELSLMQESPLVLASACLESYKTGRNLNLTDAQRAAITKDLSRLLANISKDSIKRVYSNGELKCVPHLVSQRKMEHLITKHTTGYATDVMSAVKDLRVYLETVVAKNEWNEQSYENTVMPFVIKVKKAHNKWLGKTREQSEAASLAQYVAAPIVFGNRAFSITDFIDQYGDGWPDEKKSLHKYAEYLRTTK